MDIVSLIVAAGGGSGATFIAHTGSAWFKARADRAQHKTDIDASLEQHRDKLTFDLLEAAREEVAAARVEATEMRSLQLRLTHFEEALEHVQALLDASEPGDRLAAERRARQFLTRMKRISEARGAIANEAQVIESRRHLEGNDE